jgi:moderate conductance mechanosensitive channel
MAAIPSLTRPARNPPSQPRPLAGSQVHTIPFGQVLSVTNYSRDWSVVKFNLHLEPTADIETVRKTIKRVGEELLDDPEIGSEFMQPLKMQGVVDVLQTALVVRCKFTATPLHPTYLQRQGVASAN